MKIKRFRYRVHRRAHIVVRFPADARVESLNRIPYNNYVIRENPMVASAHLFDSVFSSKSTLKSNRIISWFLFCLVCFFFFYTQRQN